MGMISPVLDPTRDIWSNFKRKEMFQEVNIPTFFYCKIEFFVFPVLLSPSCLCLLSGTFSRSPASHQWIPICWLRCISCALLIIWRLSMFLFICLFHFYHLLPFMYSSVICSSINRYMRLSCIALFISGNLNNNELPHASRSLSIYIYFPHFISPSVHMAVTPSPSVGWLADLLSLITLPSLPQARCEDFFFFFFSCVRGWVCVSTDAAVCYLRQYNVHSWMLEVKWAAISDCTNTAAHRIPQDIWVSSVLPLSLFPFRLATIQTSLVSSQRKSVGWKPGQLSQTALGQDLAGVDGVLESY